MITCKISLYWHRFVLSTFVFEPPKYIDKYGWRKVSDVEYEALFVFWTRIGNAMGIKDIPPSLKEYKEWIENYEKKNFVYSESNRNVAVDAYQVEGILCYWIE